MKASISSLWLRRTPKPLLVPLSQLALLAALLLGTPAAHAQSQSPSAPERARSLGESSTRPLSTLQTLEPADARLVSEQRPLQGAAALLCRLQPKRFLLHNGSLDADGRAVLSPGPVPTIGLLAQDTVKVVPEAVYRPIDDAREFWMIDYEQFVPLLVRAIQEHQSEISSHSSKIQTLENKVRDLEAQNQAILARLDELQHITKVIDSATRSAVSGLRSDISALSTRVTTAESKTSCSCSK